MNAVMTDNPEVYTVKQAGTVLGISEWAVYRAAKKGYIPSVKLGKRVYIPRIRLLELIAGDSPNTEGSTARTG